MRALLKPPLAAAVLAVVLVGCAGPEQKFGRGLTNLGEFTRFGEISRSFEQGQVLDGPDSTATSLVHGLNRSLARTGVGLYEILTFPFPNYKNRDYGPIYKPGSPVYPDSYTPGMFADSTTSADAAIGFGYGDIAPFVPGSRFRIFEP